MTSLDFFTTVWMAFAVCALFAFAAVTLGPGFGARALAHRLLLANASMGACLLFRVLAPNPMPSLGYAFMWTLWMTATATMVSALRMLSDQPQRDHRLALMVICSALALTLPAVISNSAQLVAVVASICVTWGAAIGALSAWQIRLPNFNRIRFWLFGSFALGAISAAAHIPVRMAEYLQGKSVMAHSAMTYVSLLMLWVASNVGLMLLVQMRLAERVTHLALHDELTGALNRRGLSQRLKEQTTRGAVVLVDIDHFKLVNDRWGHETGDQVLRWFCQQLQGFVRTDDLLVRLGGEEFAVVMAHCSLQETQTRAEQICTYFSEQIRFDRGGDPVRITASFGVADFSGREATLREDLKRADEALYTAKSAGRNRVRCWQPAQVIAIDPFDHQSSSDTVVV